MKTNRSKSAENVNASTAETLLKQILQNFYIKIKNACDKSINYVSINFTVNTFTKTIPFVYLNKSIGGHNLLDHQDEQLR